MKKTVFFLSLLPLAATVLTGSCQSVDEDLLPELANEIKLQEPATLPVLTLQAKNLQASSVDLEATITQAGETQISQRGFLYSTTNTDPLLNGTDVNKRISFDKNDVFTYSIKSLRVNTTYHARSYLILSTRDTVYSNLVSFTPTLRTPAVQTLPVFNRVKRAAIVCGQFTQGGDGIRSYGICISENPCPTVKGDLHIAATDTATDIAYRGKFGVFFDNLKENTLYHVRAYAINTTDTVYGNDRIFKTTSGGNFNWQFNNTEGAKADGAYERIVTHVDSALYYYRNYTNLNKYLWVNYAPGTPTADCNIEGWMRVGSNSRYQWVGTIQHEMCHALGVGTASNWMSFGSPWDKEKATLTLRVMMKDMSVNVAHDGMHFWPGGINQQEEVTQGTPNNKKNYTLKGDLMLKANALIINAMREDGLTAY